MQFLRRPVVLLVLVVVGAIGAVIVARRTDPQSIARPAATVDAGSLPVLAPQAPAVVSPQWLNTEPLSPAALENKVVLYDFWTFGCINCKNTLPYVKAWHDRYAADGLVILSIHTPEFSYEAVPESVAEFVRHNGIRYPVALDPDKANWRAFANRYWPAFYLHDRNGARRYEHFGEGSYSQTESVIRALLGVDASSARAQVVA